MPPARRLAIFGDLWSDPLELKQQMDKAGRTPDIVRFVRVPLLPLLPLTVLGQNLDGQTAVYAGAFAKPVEASCAFCVHSISTPEQFQI